MELFKNASFNFISMRKVAYVISSIVILAGIVSLVVKGGPKLGIDFTGGTQIQLNFTKEISNDQLRNAFGEIGYKNVSIQRFVGSNIILFTLQRVEQKTDDIIANLKQKINVDFTLESVEVVGPVVGLWLIQRAILAFCLAFLGIIIYVAFRFKGGIWGVSGVIALVHDVLVTIGIFSILNKEITLTVVAALMTIVGYSINDTIVIYDRIRDNSKLRYKDPLDVLINDSVNQTLSRTFITTGCTLLPVIALVFFGGETLHDFSFALLIGMISGVYSTVYVASPIVYDWKTRKNKVVAQNK
jgi:preprotein translocase subunit SecF